MTLLEDINWRKRPLARRLISEPVTRRSGLKSLLKVEQRFQWIGEGVDHVEPQLLTGQPHLKDRRRPSRPNIYGQFLALSRGKC